MNSKHTLMAIGLAAALAAGPALAREGDVPHLDHAFVIMMENHSFAEIYNTNPENSFTYGYANSANLAMNYFGVGHPSLTNYLEVVGGSNFGVINDFSPDWHNTTCTPNIVSGVVSNEASTANICPIAGAGMDGATPSIDTTNEGTPNSPVYNDALPPAHTVGRTIADQLVEAGKSWKSYEESQPPYGADGVNNSDGLVTDAIDGKNTVPASGVPALFAVKHSPFVYFADIQSGRHPHNSLRNVVGFERLYEDLRSGNVPNFSFIVPNQCHDGHGRGSNQVGPYCQNDPQITAAGDAALKVLVNSIKASPAWREGNNAIVVVWDENDYGTEPNQVVAIVDTNYGVKGTTSNVKYNHFSLLKTLEAGFGLGYLNHAADTDVSVMSDLFAR